MKSKLMEESGLSLERLDAFCKIVKAGGLTHAASAHGGGRETMSRQMTALNKYFGVTLLKRTTNGMEATELGREFYNIIQFDLRLIEDFRAKCAGLPAQIRITASNSLIHWTVAPQLGEFARLLPDMRFEIRAQPTHGRLPAVRNHECDFAIVRKETITAGLKSEPLLTIKYLLVVPRRLLAKARTSNVNRLLEKLPLALPPHGDFRQKLNTAADERGIKPRVVLDAGSFTMAARAVQTGQFAAILPHIAARDFDKSKFEALAIPLLSNYAPQLHFCWNPKHAEISKASAQARPILLELLRRK